MQSKVGDLDARLEALAGRIDAAMIRARVWVERPEPSLAKDERAALVAQLRNAEASALLQAQRCQALEDRGVQLEAALVGAREQRAQAVAAAESVRQQAERARDQLEAAREGGGASIDNELSQALQAKLLEVERLTSELVALRRSNEDWRGRARNYRRDLERLTTEFEKTSAQLAELRSRDEASSKRLAELERLVGEQRRELELAERRARHLRQHMTGAG